ncbi:MAG: UbiX family flavin prenyltransferase [Proteobacteria bacterium]|nr:UbiX family flavin prenyltransferase [Pseudomonadota bacterium]
MSQRLIIGISGASGVIYGIRILETLKHYETIETHLVMTSSAEHTIQLETDYSAGKVKKLATICHDPENMAAAISSGSFQTMGMVVMPCSIKSLSGIVNCFNDNLLIRAADVTLKENRKLVLVPRETPLHKGHLELMVRFVDRGGVLIPPFPAFYHAPQTVHDIVDQTVGKVLDQFQIEHNLFQRWK